MLDFIDFITERGGDPQKVRESQRRRYADEGIVDEVIKLYEEARASLNIPSSESPTPDSKTSEIRSIPNQNSDQWRTKGDWAAEEGV